MLTAVVVLAAFAVTVSSDHRSLVVLSGSMAPDFPRGALVIARPLVLSQIDVDDVILVPPAQGGAPPLLHRVVTVRQVGDDVVVQTKGDANGEVDSTPFVLQRPTHTPRFTIPVLGYLVGTARTPIGWLLLVVVPGAVMTGRSMQRVWRQPGSEPRG